MISTKPSQTVAASPLLPGITVLIPVYNRGESVKSTLRSLELQSRRPERVILIDNNSIDNSLEVISDWASEKNSEGWEVSVIRELTPGAAAARKAGERLITTRYACFFDSDDLMHPDFVEKAMEDFDNDPELKITAWSLRFNNPDGKKRIRRILPGRPLENHLVQGLLSTQAYAVDTTYLRASGGWNPAIGGWDDWELGLRLLMGGGKLKVCSDVRAEITVQEDSITGLSYMHRKGDWERTIDEMESLTLASMGPRALNRNFDDKTAKRILRLLAYRRAILAAHYKKEGDNAGAKKLLKKALSEPSLSPLRKRLLSLAYHYTAIGLPGAGGIFPALL